MKRTTKNKPEENEEKVTPAPIEETDGTHDVPNDRGAVDEGQDPVKPEENEEESDGEIMIAFHDPFKGETNRTFSLAVHGKNYKAVAKQFAEKFNGKKV